MSQVREGTTHKKPVPDDDFLTSKVRESREGQRGSRRLLEGG